MLLNGKSTIPDRQLQYELGVENNSNTAEYKQSVKVDCTVKIKVKNEDGTTTVYRITFHDQRLIDCIAIKVLGLFK